MVYRVRLTGYLIPSPDNATLMTTSDCCTETDDYIVCSYSTLRPFTLSSAVVVDVLPLADGEVARQVSATQWCFITTASYHVHGPLQCQANTSMCLQITDSFILGGVHLPSHVFTGMTMAPQWYNNLYLDNAPVQLAKELLLKVVLATASAFTTIHNHITKGRIQVQLSSQTITRLKDPVHNVSYSPISWLAIVQITAAAASIFALLTSLVMW
ncbi:unnamed protein product [Caretta caretta]